MGEQWSRLLGVMLVACGNAQGPPEPSEEESVIASEELESDEAAPAESDPYALPTTIDGLVEHFSGGLGLWLNGLYPTLDLPEMTPPQAVLEAMFQLISFDEGRVTEFEILEERVVQIDEADYKALRLTTNQGPKIVLMRYGSEWWTRVYDGSEP
jgi:hypothetical protein